MKKTMGKINMEHKRGGGWKMIFLFNSVILRFHANFPERKKAFFQQKLPPKSSSWWFQPLWKILVKLDDFPK